MREHGSANGVVGESEDGRTARRDRNRDAVLDAVLDLFDEDRLSPTAREVAERSGVSLRSVYRYYEDMDELVRAAIARHVERIDPLFVLDSPGVGPLGERVERIVAQRLALHEAVAPTMRAALLSARTNDVVAAQIDLRLGRLLDQVRRMFAPELRARPASERREVVGALDLVLGFEGIEHLRGQRGLSVAETRRALSRMIHGVLATVT